MIIIIVWNYNYTRYDLNCWRAQQYAESQFKIAESADLDRGKVASDLGEEKIMHMLNKLHFSLHMFVSNLRYKRLPKLN